MATPQRPDTFEQLHEESHEVRQPSSIEQLVQHSPIPVIAEGRIETPEQASAALAAGAYAVVVGSAITRPATITRRFVVLGSQASCRVNE